MQTYELRRQVCWAHYAGSDGEPHPENVRVWRGERSPGGKVGWVESWGASMLAEEFGSDQEGAPAGGEKAYGF